MGPEQGSMGFGVFVVYLHHQDSSFVALGYTILRRTRSTKKCVLRGLASGGINPLE